MKLADIPQPSSGGSDFSLKDCLSYDHTKLDAKCMAVWPKVWTSLRHDPVEASTVASQVVTKMVHNYSHVHQLHRLINKYLEALRSMAGENLPASVAFPDILRHQLEDCFLDTSEQQMALIWKNLLADFIDYVKTSQLGVLHTSAQTVSQLIWVCMRNLRVKTTTRQEILRQICKQFFDMKDTAILPLLHQATEPRSIYCAAVLVHAWSAFPLLFRDKYAISMDDSLVTIDAVLRCLQLCSDAHPELIYWRHRLVLQKFILSGEWKF